MDKHDRRKQKKGLPVMVALCGSRCNVRRSGSIEQTPQVVQRPC